MDMRSGRSSRRAPEAFEVQPGRYVGLDRGQQVRGHETVFQWPRRSEVSWATVDVETKKSRRRRWSRFICGDVPSSYIGPAGKPPPMTNVTGPFERPRPSDPRFTRGAVDDRGGLEVAEPLPTTASTWPLYFSWTNPGSVMYSMASSSWWTELTTNGRPMASMRALGGVVGDADADLFLRLAEEARHLTPALRMKVKGPGSARFISLKTRGRGRRIDHLAQVLQRREKLAFGLRSRAGPSSRAPWWSPRHRQTSTPNRKG